MSIRVIAKFFPKSDKIDEVKAILSEFVEPTRAEKGCIVYELLQNAAEASDLTFYEEWETAEDLAVHSQSEHLAIGRKKLEGLLEKPGDVKKYVLVK
jgi:quinol monooxygenase YgiN